MGTITIGTLLISQAYGNTIGGTYPVSYSSIGSSGDYYNFTATIEWGEVFSDSIVETYYTLILDNARFISYYYEEFPPSEGNNYIPYTIPFIIG